jgi:hypothetical protein
MDHKLAIVIVSGDSNNPVQASRVLLEHFQNVPLDNAPVRFEQKFRYKRVGGWFDGLVYGHVGQERWSTVLRMLLEGARTNVKSPFAGFGPETGAEIESRIEADNTIDLGDIWPLAPSSVIVTPKGEWLAHPNPDHLDNPPSDVTDAQVEEDETWASVKRTLFWEYRGAKAVAWDLSWHFIGAPAENKKSSRARMARAWGNSHKGH